MFRRKFPQTMPERDWDLVVAALGQGPHLLGGPDVVDCSEPDLASCAGRLLPIGPVQSECLHGHAVVDNSQSFPDSHLNLDFVNELE